MWCCSKYIVLLCWILFSTVDVSILITMMNVRLLGLCWLGFLLLSPIVGWLFSVLLTASRTLILPGSPSDEMSRADELIHPMKWSMPRSVNITHPCLCATPPPGLFLDRTLLPVSKARRRHCSPWATGGCRWTSAVYAAALLCFRQCWSSAQRNACAVAAVRSLRFDTTPRSEDSGRPVIPLLPISSPWYWTCCMHVE